MIRMLISVLVKLGVTKFHPATNVKSRKLYKLSSIYSSMRHELLTRVCQCCSVAYREAGFHVPSALLAQPDSS